MRSGRRDGWVTGLWLNVINSGNEVDAQSQGTVDGAEYVLAQAMLWVGRRQLSAVPQASHWTTTAAAAVAAEPSHTSTQLLSSPSQPSHIKVDQSSSW